MDNIINNLAVIPSTLNSSQDFSKEFEDVLVFSPSSSDLYERESSCTSLSDAIDDALVIVDDTASFLFGGSSSSSDIVSDETDGNNAGMLLFGDGDGVFVNDEGGALIQGPSLSLDSAAECDKFKAYADSRQMTPLQEKWNALTIIPNPIYCLFYLLAGKWLSEEVISDTKEVLISSTDQDWFDAADQFTLLSFFGMDSNYCLSNPLFPSLYSLPPLPVMAVAAGIILHAPFSFIYHWHYTHRLPPGSARINHWSRRMDQSFIHVCSAFMAYGTSGRWNFFWVNALYNLDCIYRQFKRRVHPRRNQLRIYISIIAYTLPILRRGDTILFLKLWMILVVSGWLFAKYPIKGWSHSAFHMVVSLIPPLLMKAASGLAASQAQIRIAARCAVLAGHG